MKKYRLLKDTPTIKAGTIFEEIVNMSDGTRELTVAVPGEDTPQDPQFTIQDIDNFDEWFEEMEEPTDSIHWKPKYDDWYFYISDHGSVCSDIWNDNYTDNKRLAFGFVYRTEEECEEARDRRLAKVRLEQTSNFEPDPNKGELGWIVGYSCRAKKLAIERFTYSHYGETIHFKTAEDARRSIEENERDWKIYFGIKEKK
nr:MAG TPA: hypothetical protein [Caudoviricetes sp.]